MADRTGYPNPIQSQVPSDTIPGEAPGTAFRVHPGQNGQVWLEQLGHSRSAGWYVQKSFAIPASVLPAVLRELRKIDCLTPRPVRGNLTPNAHLRLRLAE